MPIQFESCPDHAELLREWTHSARIVSDRVRKLSVCFGNLLKAEYDVMKSEIETARLAMNEAQVSVDTHRQQHGCWPQQC
jgi:hypothetical protein